MIFRNRRCFVVFLSFLAALTCWKSDILCEPPTVDQACGIWSEGAYLAETNFDYYKLWFESNTYNNGGPLAYMLSVLPTFIAILIEILPSPDATFFAYHLFTIACAAATATMLFSLLSEAIGAPKAFLIAAVLLTNPAFSVQTDLLGMDIPLAAVAMWSICCVHRERFILAAFAATLGFFVKFNGILLTCCIVALLTFQLVITWQRDEHERWNEILRAWLINSGAMLLQVTLLAIAVRFLAAPPIPPG